MLLSRPPLLTRDLTPFEKSYFLYQRRLNERLALPFTRYFYYQKGTPGDVEWKRKIKDRRTPAREIGKYSGYGEDAWNDEALVGDRVSEPEEQIQALVRDAEDKEGGRSGVRGGKRDEVIEKPAGRVTEADEKNDVRSLNRLLMRTLYLVVKKRDKGVDRGGWGFPGCELEREESLHTVLLGFRSIWRNTFTEIVELGVRTDHRSSRWCQHEYLDRRKHAHSSSNILLP